MKISRIWKIYFSATGTTKKVVDELASALEKKLGTKGNNCNPMELLSYDFTLPQRRTSFADISNDDLVIFGVPTYAGRVPNVLLKYLNTIIGNGAMAVPVVTFGNRNFDNSLMELRDVLENAGFHTVAAAALSCEHSFSYILGAGRPDEQDFDEIHLFAEKLADSLTNLLHIPAPVSVPGIPGSYGGYYQPQDRNGIHIDIRKVVPKVKDTCINCGLCSRICPMGSISPNNISQFTGICIKCGACYKKCPVSARYFDDPGYIYHKEELEELYQRRAKNMFFISL